ncbi:MAG: DUF928 domain-containing protein [Xenococcaceae cyanobacterium MO_234.B1]|nr:DUF928 domain-containing protein [Xenococcaceae cyanobacterium MO_234.B1]
MNLRNRLSLALSVILSSFVGLSAVSRAENRIIEASGQVMLQREGWSNFRPVQVGTKVNVGDRLQVATGVEAIVRCGDNTLWRLLTGNPYPVTYGCSNNPLLLRIGKQSDNAPGGHNSAIPYVISPRRTFVRSDRVKLRWNPVAEASSYSVRLVRQRDRAVLWEQEVKGTEIDYPGKPSLEPGEEYLLVIESNNGKSSQLDEGANLSGFKRLSPDEVQQVEAERKTLAQQELSQEAKALALADIYIREELLYEAIATLESLAKTKSKMIAVYQNLGDLYRYVGLNSLAESRYQQAIALATSS